MKFIPLLLAFSALTAHASDLFFKEKVIDIHPELGAETAQVDFKFTNKGNQTLTIRAADAGCSCLAVQISDSKLTYAPGESGILRGIFNLGTFQGKVKKPIHIWLEGDSDENPSSTVTLNVHIPIAISLEPKSLQWTTDESKEPKVMKVIMNHASPIRVTSVSSTSKSFATELIEIEAGKSYGVKITPTNNTKPGLGVISIETDFKLEKYRSQQGFAVMKKAK